MEKIIYYLLNRFVMTNVEKEILSHMKNKNQVIFDIGCYKGYFTKGIIGNDKKNLKNKKFYLFDGNPNSKKFLKDAGPLLMRADDIILDSENKKKWKRRCPV